LFEFYELILGLVNKFCWLRICAIWPWSWS